MGLTTPPRKARNMALDLRFGRDPLWKRRPTLGCSANGEKEVLCLIMLIEHENNFFLASNSIKQFLDLNALEFLRDVLNKYSYQKKNKLIQQFHL